LQRYRKEFTDYNFELARIDGISMERLTKSKYITGIFGMCGASQITEYSEGGNIHDRIKEARLAHTDLIPSIDKLKIGYQIATAVADMHTFEPDGVTSLVHLDICCHQFVLIDGVYKLGDFHLSSFTAKHKDTGDICLEQPRTMHAKV
jgi:tRNA A-37 threonylcarbamoyl transferase component Bud32